VNDRRTLPLWKIGQQLGQIAARLGCLAVRCGQQIVLLVQRVVQRLLARAPAQQVDQLVARDRIDPGGDRLPRVIRMPLIVNGQKQLLHQVLDLFGQIHEPLSQKRPQMRAQILQEGMVSG